jgi:hypothetical protein
MSPPPFPKKYSYITTNYRYLYIIEKYLFYMYENPELTSCDCMHSKNTSDTDMSVSIVISCIYAWTELPVYDVSKSFRIES